MNKYLEKIGSLLKGKKLVWKDYSRRYIKNDTDKHYKLMNADIPKDELHTALHKAVGAQHGIDTSRIKDRPGAIRKFVKEISAKLESVHRRGPFKFRTEKGKLTGFGRISRPKANSLASKSSIRVYEKE